MLWLDAQNHFCGFVQFYCIPKFHFYIWTILFDISCRVFGYSCCAFGFHNRLLRLNTIISSILFRSESKLIHFFESRFLDESEVIHSRAIGRIWGIFRFCGQNESSVDSHRWVKCFGESMIDSLWEICKSILILILIAFVLGADVFCKHSVWISTNAFLGCPPNPRCCSCVTIVTLMTLVTLFWGYPYTISQIQRH